MVSIIIPLYNVENYVIDSLKSAFAQSYSDVDFLLVDDCSTDHTMQIVEEYVLNHPRREAVRIIHHDKNLGLSAARNTGLEQAYGEYVYFMDSDDEITEDCIENLYQAISDSGADWVMGNIWGSIHSVYRHSGIPGKFRLGRSAGRIHSRRSGTKRADLLDPVVSVCSGNDDDRHHSMYPPAETEKRKEIQNRSFHGNYGDDHVCNTVAVSEHHAEPVQKHRNLEGRTAVRRGAAEKNKNLKSNT